MDCRLKVNQRKTKMRRISLVIALLLIPVVSQAQQYTLTVSPQELGIIGDALGGKPYAQVAPLMKKLEQQVEQQLDAAKKAAEEANKPKE